MLELMGTYVNYSNVRKVLIFLEFSFVEGLQWSDRRDNSAICELYSQYFRITFLKFCILVHFSCKE